MNQQEQGNLAAPFVEVSNDGMQAILRIPRVGYVVSEKVVRDALATAGVTYGINDIIVQWVTKSPATTTEITVANGLPPKQGKSGTIEYKFDQVRAAEFGKPSHLHQYTFQNVEEGAVLAIRHPPEPGEAGKNVRGNRVEPQPIKDISIASGENTKFKDASNNELVASCAGCIQIDPMGQITVLDHISLLQDIDNAVGNIVYFGDIFIRGDIKSGFSIKTRGKIEVAGTIEDALIEANEVEIKGGFTGSGTGEMMVATDFRSSYVVNQRVIAKNEIYVAGEVRNSHLEAGKAIFISGAKGVVLGGSLEALERIEATTFGNEIDLSCHVIVGRPRPLLDQVHVLDLEIEKAMVRVESQKRQFGLPPNFDIEKDGASVKRDSPMGRGVEIMRKVYAKVQEMIDQRRDLVAQIDQYAADSCIVVYKVCHPGVIIQIGNKSRTIDSRIERVTFRIVDGEITGVKE